MTQPLFDLGRIVATPEALELIQEAGKTPLDLIHRHLQGDWGEVDAEDAALNDRAVQDGGRLLSAYSVGTDRVWIISEADRSATTILLPEEY